MTSSSLVHGVLAGTLCAVTLALVSPAAQAATTLRSDEFTAAGMCVPATFTVSKVRNRPTGVRNESTAPLYVTCSAPAGWDGDLADAIHLQVANFGAADATINCTLMTGYPAEATANTSQGTYPQSQLVAAGGFYYFNWNSTNLTGTANALENPSWSCLLPPGAEVRAYYRDYAEEIGT